jgi:DsbC/DsbD-like thiol-disulfide interchange protein
MSDINQLKMINSFSSTSGSHGKHSVNHCSMMRNPARPLMMPIVLLALAAALGAPSPATAAKSEWASNEGGRMRLVALSPGADGTVRAALQIEPAPGWVTYWREPGESGIPPQLSVAPGSNVTLDRIGYPVPKPIAIGPIREIGYDAPVVLPLDFRIVDKTLPAEIDLDAFIGLCKEICIPFQADLSLPLPAGSQFLPEEQAIVAAADASLPASPSTGFSLQGHSLSADGKLLSLKLELPEASSEMPQVYLTGPSGTVFFRQDEARRDGRAFETEIAIGKLPKGYDLHGKRWTLLVVDGPHAMETQLAFD